MGKIIIILFLFVVGWGLYLFKPQLSLIFYEAFCGKEFYTLERLLTAEDIMQKEKESLLKGSQYTFALPKLVYSPYLLLEVKFSENQATTEESILLWSLTDGEMVQNIPYWEKTSGFADCLDCNANKNDFKILKCLSEEGGKERKERLMREFDEENETIERWIASSLRKKLIVQEGNSLRLHLAHPNLIFIPKTEGSLPLVSRSLDEMTQKKKVVYSPNQIKRLCQNAFGLPLCIRNEQLIYLPMYEITVQNPDGSFSTTTWNAFQF